MSSEYAAATASAVTRFGQSARRQASSGGVPSPPSTAPATVGTSACPLTAASRNPAPESDAEAQSTGGCRQRSTIRARIGALTAIPAV